jgi:predicted RNA-binding protein with PIN domain
VTRWVVDASNVIGARPDGWWRDRAGARDRLLDALRRFAAATGDEVVVVLDSGPAALAGRRDGVDVVVAARRGRDAADDEIVAWLQRRPDPAAYTVVTSDRALADRVGALGSPVVGARSFRERLEAD